MGLKTVLTCLMLSAIACGGSKKNNEFMDHIRAYNDGIRWRNSDIAAAHIPPRERTDFLEERAELEEDLRIGDYEILRVGMSKNLDKATIRVEYSWHLDSKGIVKTTTTKQVWERFGDAWLMVEEERVRGEPMPGVAEPIPEGAEPLAPEGGSDKPAALSEIPGKTG